MKKILRELAILTVLAMLMVAVMIGAVAITKMTQMPMPQTSAFWPGG